VRTRAIDTIGTACRAIIGTVIEKALPTVLSDANLKLDPLHPTAQGHRVLAERAADELADIGFGAKR